MEALLLRLAAGGMLRGGLIDGALEVDVAKSTRAALGDDDLLSRRRDVRDDEPRLAVRHERAARHVDDQVLSAAPVAASAGAGHAGFREELGVVVEG